MSRTVDHPDDLFVLCHVSTSLTMDVSQRIIDSRLLQQQIYYIASAKRGS